MSKNNFLKYYFLHGPSGTHSLGVKAKTRRGKLLTLWELNVCGCGMNEKKCMILDMFKERKLDTLALSEPKVKGQGVQEWEG